MKDNTSSFNSSEYDNRIMTVLPYYKEFHNQILDFVETISFNNFKWLDTGFGTGVLAKKAVRKLRNFSLTLCDPSEEMLNIAKANLSGFEKISFRNISSQQLEYKDEFDVVTAVQAHHYLSSEERILATQRCFDVLKSGGVYITFENIAMSDEISEKVGFDRWKRYMAANGKTDAEIEQHISRRGTEVFRLP